MKVFLDALIDIMKQSEGIGIAAPQVGVPLRICIVSDNGKNHFFLSILKLRGNQRTQSRSLKDVCRYRMYLVLSHDPNESM